MHKHTPLPPDVRAVRTLTGRKVWLEYADGTAGEVDLTPLLAHPFLRRVRTDDDLFAKVFVDELGTLAWPDGTDLDPEGLHDLAAAHLRVTA
jgi:hypothetical protein